MGTEDWGWGCLCSPWWLGRGRAGAAGLRLCCLGVRAGTPPLDRIPLHKFTSIRRTMSEVAGPVEHLIAKGPLSKYAHEEPALVGGPVPEMLKNYMDVSVGLG